MSAPASAKRLRALDRRLEALRRRQASVRAMISKSASLARIDRRLDLADASPRCAITSLPAKWPQRLGATWSSSWMQSAPARSSVRTVWRTFSALPKPVSASTMIGSVDRVADARRVVGDVGQADEAQVGHAEEHVGHAGAAEVDGLEAEVLDDARGQRVGGAGHQQPRRACLRPFAAAACRDGWLVVHAHSSFMPVALTTAPRRARSASTNLHEGRARAADRARCPCP